MSDVGGLLTRMPESARAVYEAALANPQRATARFVETEEDRAERLMRRQEALAAQWNPPARYADASLTALSLAQDPDGKVTGWAASDALTLILTGPRGTGKTYAAYAIGNGLVSVGVWVTGGTVTDLHDAFRPGGDEAAFDRARNCDVLVLDDLGQERVTEWTAERIHSLIDARTRSNRRTVVTTNLNGEALAARYGEPVVDRLTDRAVGVKFTGPSRRVRFDW